MLDIYNRSDFIMEIADERKISFLNKNAKIKHLDPPSFL
jgi:hypothetical protein